MKYFVFAIFSENIRATHYGIPHDMEGEVINVEDTLPVTEPDSNTTAEAYPFLPSDWEQNDYWQDNTHCSA